MGPTAGPACHKCPRVADDEHGRRNGNAGTVVCFRMRARWYGDYPRINLRQPSRTASYANEEPPSKPPFPESGSAATRPANVQATTRFRAHKPFLSQALPEAKVTGGLEKRNRDQESLQPAVVRCIPCVMYTLRNAPLQIGTALVRSEADGPVKREKGLRLLSDAFGNLWENLVVICYLKFHFLSITKSRLEFTNQNNRRMGSVALTIPLSTSQCVRRFMFPKLIESMCRETWNNYMIFKLKLAPTNKCGILKMCMGRRSFGQCQVNVNPTLRKIEHCLT